MLVHLCGFYVLTVLGAVLDLKPWAYLKMRRTKTDALSDPNLESETQLKQGKNRN